MPTNPNMVAIQTVTVGAGGASSIDFTNIPQTYTDLVVQVSGRTDRTVDTDSMKIEVNNSTTSYTWLYLLGNNSVASSSTAQRAYVNSDYNTANTFGSAQIYIPNYTSSNNKSFSIETISENNATSGAQTELLAQLWSNTAAITSIKLSPQFGTNWKQYSTATLYGVTSAGYGAKATGGIITQDANYFYHTFLSSGTFTPTSNITADYLVVAGGGGGGGASGDGSGASGGGGGGGVRCTVGATGGGGALESAISLTNGTGYTITIGGGGNAGANGSNSSISGSGLTTITSTGGGKGGTRNTSNPATGGSGGGGYGDGTSNAGAAGTANQGYAGGSGSGVDGGSSGGGGGAGAVGQNGFRDTTQGDWYSGDGGDGIQTSISGVSTYYAGGGGGGSGDSADGWLPNPNGAGAGGLGGGGRGAQANPNGSDGAAGVANTGGGGGGRDNANSYTGKAGGSGIVVIRYAK